MKKLISFKQLKANCAWEIIQNRGTLYDCGYLSDDRVKCCARNCPVWKRLEEVKQESNRYEITTDISRLSAGWSWLSDLLEA